MNSGLNILMLLTDGFGGVGGIAKFNRDLLRALDKSHHVQRVHALPLLIPKLILDSIPESVTYQRKAAKGKIAFLLRLIKVVRRKPRPDVVVCGHIYLLPLAWIVAKLFGSRLVLIVHGIEAWLAPTKIFAKALARNVDSLIAVSRFTASKFIAWSKLTRNRVFILPNCVDLDVFRPQRRDPLLVRRYGLHARKVLLTIGRLETQERYKGFDEVLDVMPALVNKDPNLVYLIVGDGPDLARLKKKASRQGLSYNVIFTGYISEREKAAHYNLADVYVMPSTGEGFGIVLIEAAACGLPIVGSKADGSREALLDGRLGRLIDPSDPSELIEAITKALAGACSHKRIALIDLFGEEKFEMRVNEWCRLQAAAFSFSPARCLSGAPTIT